MRQLAARHAVLVPLLEGEVAPERLGELLTELGDDDAAEVLGDLARAADPRLRALARMLAARLVLPVVRSARAASHGQRRQLATVPYRFHSDDLDLERTVERLTENPFPEPGDFFVRERVGTRRAYLLLVDHSGSMAGAKLVAGALAAAALSRRTRPPDHLGVVAFWRDAAILSRQSGHREVTAEELFDRLLRLQGFGTTNLALALRAGLEEAERTPVDQVIAIAFTDGLATAGGDPLPVARRYHTLHVVGTSTEPDAVSAGRALAKAGGGRFAVATRPSEVPAALEHCLGAPSGGVGGRVVHIDPGA